jgi:hypothetical protein
VRWAASWPSDDVPAACIAWRWSLVSLTPSTMRSYWFALNSSVNTVSGAVHLEKAPPISGHDGQNRRSRGANVVVSRSRSSADRM